MLCATAVSASLAPEDGGPLRGPGGRVGPALARRGDPRARGPRLCAQRPRPLLPLQARADGRAGAACRTERVPRSRSVSTSTTSATTGPARAPPRSEARSSRSCRPASTRRRCARCRATLGLRTWDRPAAACLASRVPHGTPVTIGVLERVATAESGLRAPRLRRAAGAPLRRRRPHRAPPRGPGPGRRGARGDRARPCATPATAT